MKNFIFLLAMGFAAAAYSDTPNFEWKDAETKLGKVKLQEKQIIKFEFTNNSGSPIRIFEARGSCGCTVVNFPEKEILSGSKASLQVEFTPSKLGAFRKSIRVKTNESEAYTYLFLSGQAVE